jgi:hypothetical protein
VDLRRLAVVLALLGAVTLLTPLRGELQSWVDGSSTKEPRRGRPLTAGPTGSADGQVGAQAPSPGSAPRSKSRKGLVPLSAAEKAQAEQILRSDGRLTDLVGKAKYDVDQAILWGFTPKDEPARFEKVGVRYQINVQPPLSRSIRWRMIRLPAGPAERPYRINEIPFRAEGVRHLEVYVDLKVNAVVSIVPGPESKLTVPAKYRDRFYGHHGSD